MIKAEDTLRNSLSRTKVAGVTKANVEVTNPAHYVEQIYAEPLDNIYGVGFGFGIAYKHLARLGLKGGDNTPTRDAKASIWYIMDTLVRILTEEDGDFVPTLAMHSEFSVNSYVKDVHFFLERNAAAGRLAFAEVGPKNVTLAMLTRILNKERAMRFSGISERDYCDHVLDVLAAAYIAIAYAVAITAYESSPRTKLGARVTLHKSDHWIFAINLRELYKGTKENRLEPSDPVYDLIEQQFTMFDRAGLISQFESVDWLDPSDGFDTDD